MGKSEKHPMKVVSKSMNTNRLPVKSESSPRKRMKAKHKSKQVKKSIPKMRKANEVGLIRAELLKL